MQNIIVRDLLKILIDKAQTLKAMITDKSKMKKVTLLSEIFKNHLKKKKIQIFDMVYNYQQVSFNRKIEETISLLHIVCKIILEGL